jgi:crotonobetainyl-CoA:carnitine CoA-transferase CaiB-like acyl-CoA transferase
VSQSYALECADGKWIALHMSSPEKFWQGLATAIERPALFEDPSFRTREDRIANHEALIALLRDIFKGRSRAQWCERLQAQDVPHAPMYDTSEALNDPQARHLELEVATHHPVIGEFRTVRSPVSFDGVRSTAVTAPPLLGEHTGQVLAEIRRS